MNRKIIALDVALVALAAVLGWQIRQRWLEGQARERAIFTNAVRRMTVLGPPPLASQKPVAAVEYIDVAQKMLFSKDRNPNVVIEAPAPKPKPPLPALPQYFGQMAIGDPVVLLATASSPQKSYRAGEKVGPFEIAAFDSETITLLWEDETIVRRLEDLRPAQNAAPPAAAPGGRGSAAAPALTSVGAASSAKSADDKSPIGVDVGGGFFACKPGDTTPSGTVVDGRKKVIGHGLMGDSCQWEVVK